LRASFTERESPDIIAVQVIRHDEASLEAVTFQDFLSGTGIEVDRGIKRA
jgi:hypothetical protein